MTASGTTPTGTDVQHAADLSQAALVALDASLIGNVNAKATAANKSAGTLVSGLADLAVAMVELHQAGTWQRQTDPTTGQTYTSAKAFYRALHAEDKFPVLHRILRTELVEILMDGDQLTVIGTNELAALVGCDPAQITRATKAIAAAAPPAPPAPAISEEELDTVAAEAAAAAKADGKNAAAAKHAAEAARAKAKAEAEELAEAERKVAAAAKAKADAKAKAAAEVKATDKAFKAFTNATEAVLDRFHLMSDEQREEVLSLIDDASDQLHGFMELQPKADAS